MEHIATDHSQSVFLEKIETYRNDAERVYKPPHRLATINSLPNELLEHIFHLTRSCYISHNDPWPTVRLVSHDCLTRVCSRWRHISLGSRALWPHIALALFEPCKRGRGPVIRAKVFAIRTDHDPLDIYVHNWNSATEDDRDFAGLCTSFNIAAWTRSLELYISQYVRFQFWMLDCFFSGCVPGTLTRLRFFLEFKFIVF